MDFHQSPRDDGHPSFPSLTQSDIHFQNKEHSSSLACLMHCTQWVLKIEDWTDESKKEYIGEIQNPTVNFKHCPKTSPSSTDPQSSED